MTFQQYKDQKRLKHSGKAYSPDIDDRWKNRIVANGWHQTGTTGANDYLARYGKSIGEDKLCRLACRAEGENATAMAERFWEEAYKKSGGTGSTAPAPAPAAAPAKVKSTVLSGFAATLHPSKLPWTKLTKKPTNLAVRAAIYATPEKAEAFDEKEAPLPLDPQVVQALCMAAKMVETFVVYGALKVTKGATDLSVAGVLLHKKWNLLTNEKSEQVEAVQEIVPFIDAAWDVVADGKHALTLR